VQVDVASIGLGEDEALRRLREEGVLLSPTKPGTLRAVTSLEITDDDVEEALRAVPRAIGARVGV